MIDEYVRQVVVLDVVDGDTFRVDVDLGFHLRARMLCRLAGLNAPEHDEPGGAEAREALASLLSDRDVSVRSVRVDKYAGRFDAQVFAFDPPRAPNPQRVWHVNGWLVEQGFAVAWDGRGPKPPVPWPPAKERS